MSVTGVSFRNSINNLESSERIKDRNNQIKPEKVAVKEDTFEKQNPPKLPKLVKQKIIKDANCNAAGWSIFGGLISLAYYALRSDKTIADKYNLDIEKDRGFISDIRRSQVKWTIPGIFFIFGGTLSYLYNTFRSARKIEVN